MGSPNLFLPSGITLDCHKPILSDVSSSSLPVQQPNLHLRTGKPGENAATEFAVDAGDVCETWFAVLNDNQLEDHHRADWTPESCLDTLSAWTEISGDKIRNPNLTINGNGHASLTPLKPVVEDFMQHKGDFALFDVDVVGVGEQFARYEFCVVIVALLNMAANMTIISEPL